MKHGSLVNHVAKPADTALAVGDGMTECSWTDRHACTVISVSPSGKTAQVQEDIAIRIDENGVSDAQSYRYERNPDGAVTTIRLTKNGWSHKGRKYIMGRHHYYDFSF